jgi:hypothetical protein
MNGSGGSAAALGGAAVSANEAASSSRKPDPREVGEIIVAPSWRANEGQEVPGLPGLYIGERFGHGALAMNSIFEVLERSGDRSGFALKVCRPTIAARRSLAHEWKIFKDLALLGEKHAVAKTHFLQARTE